MKTRKSKAKTTAEWRRRALDYEKQLKWELAATCWNEAILAYPESVGDLAKLDLSKMASRRDDCMQIWKTGGNNVSNTI